MISDEQLKFFKDQGFLPLENILDGEEMEFYSQTYDSFINNEFDTTDLRSDLSGVKDSNRELITQIMLPSSVYPDLLQHPPCIKRV